MMDYPAALSIFRAQTTNLRTLNQAITHINRTINNALRKDDNISASVYTKVLALTFSAWAEVSLSKLIHTPHGFSLDEIRQIKLAHQQNGLERGWEKCLELALRKVSSSRKPSEIPNRRQKLLEIIREYIIDPSLIRNKVAHGQWTIALNRENTTVNAELTDRLTNLDVVKVSIWLQVYQFLSRIIEDLIESPNRTFHRDYWLHLTELEAFLGRAQSWTLNNRINILKRKPLRS